ncbi:class II aldolase/adducin family protein [Mobiluncus curtisii]|uniref:Class II aldolase/adducin family protein n=2 Tax=Mobiluncus curtisii TaxID=2051 RepID=A0A2X3AL71_9ACTO|nr:class II aldolase/adducin family protein [Mobiluncus curtisii]ADI66620.1 putative L-ribulose-5-phosphate 4-epimerase [Mobiluncus curtisii ATCC 43063]EFL93112.1 putative L-ribulose-5-phosphate 4-epimerase [Mobiluncus curtisii subsp. curtisii ATCC 35241]MCU9986883.1 class II aldolase/adducin family protein [Mobiluncus curtisii]MCU9999783.1 class II aldolase/adducin family protein [Mobiluncus curtisii]MCV0019879.1 class II aldolase/adducin family protein [Mobiluncus curtisii]
MTGNAGRDDETGNAIIDTARVLLREGLVARTWGNLSQRSGHDRYLITPSGRDYETMTPDHLVEVDFEGKWSGELKPSGERGLHTEIYRELPQVQFIIHTHQPYASALSVGGAPVEIPTELAERIGSETLPIADYGLPSTGKLHKSVLTTLRDTAARAILMQGHGAVLFGRDADELVDLAQAVESACQIQFELMTGWSRAGETVRVRRFERDGIGLPPQVIHIFMRRDDAGAVVATDDPLFLKFRETGLKAYLDDFSQLVGLKVGKTFGKNMIYGRKATYFLGADLDEAEAVFSVAQKNALAALVAETTGAKPIRMMDGTIMRGVYKLKYSKLKDK